MPVAKMYTEGHGQTEADEQQPESQSLAAAGFGNKARCTADTVTGTGAELKVSLHAEREEENAANDDAKPTEAAESGGEQATAPTEITPAEATTSTETGKIAGGPDMHADHCKEVIDLFAAGRLQQELKQEHDVGAAMSSVLAAAASAGHMPESAPKTSEEDGHTSSVLSKLLSAALRQLLPWVLPSALRGATPASVRVNISKKQLTLSGVSLQPQELTSLVGAPLELLHCSIGNLQLQMGRQGALTVAAAASVGKDTTSSSGSWTTEGIPACSSTTPLAPDEQNKYDSKKDSGSLLLSLKDVIVVLTPTRPAEWSRDQLLELALRRRRSLLHSIDSKQQQKQLLQPSGLSANVAGVISHWIDRHIQWASVEVLNLHIRVECLVPLSKTSNSSCARAAFALGLHFKELRMRTVPPEESNVPRASMRREEQQEKRGIPEAAATSPHQATTEPSVKAGRIEGHSSSNKDSFCSEFNVRGFSSYTQNELLLLAPHTCSVTEMIEKLRASRVLIRQENEYPPSARKGGKQLQSEGGQQRDVDDRLSSTSNFSPTGQQRRCRRTSTNGRCLLAPVNVYISLRKKSLVESNLPSGRSSSRVEGVTVREDSGSFMDNCQAVFSQGKLFTTTDPAYIATVDSEGLQLAVNPAGVRGLRWLVASFEEHRRAIDTAEAVLSLVRPFAPSCTVHGNPGIWWRFAIRAVCRLQREMSITARTSNSQATVPTEGVLPVEETLKLRLCAEKSEKYRCLRRLQLQGTLTQTQEEQLLHLTNTLPLPHLLKAHSAARQDLMEQQGEVTGRAPGKTWARWLPVWGKRRSQQGSGATRNTSAAVGFNEIALRERKTGCSVRPVPPLSLQAILDQNRLQNRGHPERGERRTQGEELQQQWQNNGQHEQLGSSVEGAPPGEFDYFFDARSQPATARFTGDSTSVLQIEQSAVSQATLPLAAASATHSLQRSHSKEEPSHTLPQLQGLTAFGGRANSEITRQEGHECPTIPVTEVEPAVCAMNTDEKEGLCKDSDLSEADEIFYDCLDFQPPQQSLSPHEDASPAAAAATSAEATNPQSEVQPRSASAQAAYTLSGSVLLRSASVTFCTDVQPFRETELQLNQQQRLPPQQQKESQRTEDNYLVCNVGPVCVDGLIGNDKVTGSVSVDYLRINYKGRGLQNEQTLVFEDNKIGDKPLLSVQITGNCVGTVYEGQVDGRDSNFLSLSIRRLICILDPKALRGLTTIQERFTAAVAETALAAVSQQCSLLHLRGTMRRDYTCTREGRGGFLGFQVTSGCAGPQRQLSLSPKRQQQLRESALLQYAVCIEAPTVIAPALEGRAVLCHLGELRVCSAQRKQLLQPTGGKENDAESVNLEFFDSFLHERYGHRFTASTAGSHTARAPATEASCFPATARAHLLRRVNVMTHHGVLLRDSHILFHSNLEQLKKELEPLQSHDSSGSRSGLGAWCSSQRPSRDRRHCEHLFRSQKYRFGRHRRNIWHHEFGESRSHPMDKTEHSLPRGIKGVAQPILLPSEFGAVIEVKHIDIYDARELFLPRKLRCFLKEQQQLQTQFFSSATTAVGCHPCRRCDTAEKKQTEIQGMIPQSSLQEQKHHRQEEYGIRASDGQAQLRCEVQVDVNGDFGEVEISLSHYGCTTLLSAVNFLKATLLRRETATSSRECMDSSCFRKTVPNPAAAGGPSTELSRDQRIDGHTEASGIIPIYISGSVGCEKMTVFFHNLNNNADMPRGIDWNESSPTMRDYQAAVEDVLLVRAISVRGRFNSRSTMTIEQLQVNQLLLEQPCFPVACPNRYIVRLPSSGNIPTVACFNPASISQQAPSVLLELSSGMCKNSAAATSYSCASLFFMRPMALNFRPTPVSWLLRFLKAPAWQFGSINRNSVIDNSNDSHKATGNIKGAPQDYRLAGKATECLQEFQLETSASADGCDEVQSRQGDSAKTPFEEGDDAPPKYAAEVYSDPVLQDIKVKFQIVDILWSSHGADPPLATAALSAASMNLRLHRHSTKITASIQDFSVHCVVPNVENRPHPNCVSARKQARRASVQPVQTACCGILGCSAKGVSIHERFRFRTKLLTTEVIGVVPGSASAFSVSLDSMHPLSPEFSGLSSSLKVELGTYRVTYVHSQFWRLFNWLIGDFFGTLISSHVPSPSSSNTRGPASRSSPPEAAPRPIQHSPSLRDLARRSVVKSEAEVNRRGFVLPTAEGDGQNADTNSDALDRKSFIVPNEGLQHIFLLADAGRSILGMTPLFQQQTQGVEEGNTGEEKLQRLLLPETLPFNVFHYEVRFSCPRLLLPASCKSSGTRAIFWPPAYSHCKCTTEYRLVDDSCYRRRDPTADGNVSACSDCTNWAADSKKSNLVSARQIICLLDNVTVTNSWRLSRRHGIVESINVFFEGAKAFASTDCCAQSSLGQTTLCQQQASGAEFWAGSCRRCGSRGSLDALPPAEAPDVNMFGVPTTTPLEASEFTCRTSGSPGSYLFGSADFVVRVLRPALVRSSSHWIRVEAGLLPVSLDAQALRLIFEVFENNFSTRDHYTASKHAVFEPQAGSLRDRSGNHQTIQEVQRADCDTDSKAEKCFPKYSLTSEGKSTINSDKYGDTGVLFQRLQEQKTLQGLLEPQVDFVELLEEWGHETYLLELVVQGLHLAAFEYPVKKHSLLLRKQCGAFRSRIWALKQKQGRQPMFCSDNCPRSNLPPYGGIEYAERRPFLLLHATRLRAQLRSLQLPPHQAEQVGLLVSTSSSASQGNQGKRDGEYQSETHRILPPPVRGTFLGMRLGSSTVFSPDLALPFSVVFTNSTCPLGLLQQQLEPLTEGIWRAESGSIAAAVKMGDRSLGSETSAFGCRSEDAEGVEQSASQLPMDSPRLLRQEEHPLLTAFSAPWVDPLHLEDQMKDTQNEDCQPTSCSSAQTRAATTPGQGHVSCCKASKTAGRTDSRDAAVEMPSFSGNYVPLFRCGLQRSQQQKGQNGVLAKLLMPQQAELSLFCKWATASPVTPLLDDAVHNIPECRNLTAKERFLMVQRLLLQRQCQRKQQRISLSSERTRCVLSLPLITRISGFFSDYEATSGTVHRHAAAFRTGGSAEMTQGNSWKSANHHGRVVWPMSCDVTQPAQSISDDSQAVFGSEPPSCSARKVCFNCPGGRRWTHRGTSRRGSDKKKLNDVSCAAVGDKKLGTISGRHDLNQLSDIDPAVWARSNSLARTASHTAFSVSGDDQRDVHLTHFGSKALALCQSSFASVKRFASGISSQSSKDALGAYVEHGLTDSEGVDSSCETNTELQKVEIDERYHLQQAGFLGICAAVSPSQKTMLPPLQLTSKDIVIYLSEASVLLPVDGTEYESGSVLLRGSVNLRRRADDILDPIGHCNTSGDASAAAGAFEDIWKCDSAGDRTLWGVVRANMASAQEKQIGGTLLQQQEPLREAETRSLGSLPDKFCPGIRGIDILLQKATVTCLRNSKPLQQIDASTKDLLRRHKHLQLRHWRSLRRLNSGSKRTGAAAEVFPKQSLQGLGMREVALDELRSATAQAEVEAYVNASDVATVLVQHTADGSTLARDTPVEKFAKVHTKCKISGPVDRPVDASKEADSTAPRALLQSNARIICSDFSAHLSHISTPPTFSHQSQSESCSGGLLHGLKISSKAASKSASKSASESIGVHSSCCSRITRATRSSSAKVDTGSLGRICDCCCHHPQEHTVLHVGPCELELSYLDCLLICRCAAQQIRQAEEQQCRRERQVAVFLRLFHHSLALKQQLASGQQFSRKQYVESDPTPSVVTQGLSTPSSVPRAAFTQGRRGTYSKLRPNAPTPCANRNLHTSPSFPRQSRVLACLPLLRVTLLNDHLDCLQAPLLQLLMLDSCFSRACSVLPPLRTEALGILRHRPQREQISSVNLLEGSLFLWAFNPLAVAFEPVVESLPLALVIREASYSLMQYAYRSRCDDDNEALALRHCGGRTARSKRQSSWPPSFLHRHGRNRGILRKPGLLVPFNTATLPKNSSNSSSSGYETGMMDESTDSVGRLLPHISKNAADREASMFRNQQQKSSSDNDRLAPAQLHMREGLESLHRETNMVTTHFEGDESFVLQSGIKGAAGSENCGGTIAEAPGATSPAERYLGILLSSTPGSSIEANLSPLLLQSVVGSLCKWHCDFAHHMQQPQEGQRQVRRATACQGHLTRRRRTPQVLHRHVSDSDQQQARQVQEQRYSAFHHIEGHSAGEPEDFHEREPQASVGRTNDCFGGHLCSKAHRRCSSCSLEASPSGCSPFQDTQISMHENVDHVSDYARKSASKTEADGAVNEERCQQEQRPHLEAADPKRGKVFIPYHVVNQTGLHLGILLLPEETAARTAHSDVVSGRRTISAVEAEQYGLPRTLRLCHRHNRSTWGTGQYSSSDDSNSSTSEAEIGRNLAAAPVSWDFGPTLQKTPFGFFGSAISTATVKSSDTVTASCPASPSTVHEAEDSGLQNWEAAARWEWLSPSEERALTQMRVSVGTASTAHVALQLADQAAGEFGAQQPLRRSTPKTKAFCTEAENNNESLDGFSKKWMLGMPVPLDRIGVYIQPLPETKMTALSGASPAKSAVKESVPFVICRLIASGGTKQLLVQSQVVLRSSCSTPLQLMLLPLVESRGPGQQDEELRLRENGGNKKKNECLPLLKPGETLAVPVNFCFTGRFRVRPLLSGETFTWSKELSLDTLWRVVEGQQNQKPHDEAASEARRDAINRQLSKTDLLRCSPCISSTGRSCKASRHAKSTDEECSFEQQELQNAPTKRRPDYHIVVSYRQERLFHTSFSCIQLKVSFEAPLRIASNIPFPIRYRVQCPLPVKAGEDPPEDSEGILQLNERRRVHSLPLTGVAFLSVSLTEGQWSKRTQVQPPPLHRRHSSASIPSQTVSSSSAAAGSHLGAGKAPAECVRDDILESLKKESSGETAAGETFIEVECLDRRSCSVKLWLIFCESDGRSPSLLLHAPVWLVSHVQWAFQRKWLQQPRKLDKPDSAEERNMKRPAVEYSIIRRNTTTGASWAMQAVSAAAAAVDLQGDTRQPKPSKVPKFESPCRSILTQDCTGDIRLLDFSVGQAVLKATSSIRVEAEGIGCSEYLDVWGEFPRRLSVAANPSAPRQTYETYPRMISKEEKDCTSSPQGSENGEVGLSGKKATSRGGEASRPSRLESAFKNSMGGPCLDVVAAILEAPLPLLRPVLLLTLSPMYTITSRCPFPIRIRQARPSCFFEGNTGVSRETLGFTMELQPQHTEPLVWQFNYGIRAIQLQGLVPSLCWLQEGCSRGRTAESVDSTSDSVWSTWSGYSPLCCTGENWCMRIPNVPLKLPGATPSALRRHGSAARGEELSSNFHQNQAESLLNQHKQPPRRLQASGHTVKPQDFLVALLRRGVSVKAPGNLPRRRQQPPEQFMNRAYAALGCSSLRLESTAGPASTVNLTIQREQFEFRDVVLICNDTALPLMVRQCRHRGSQTESESVQVGHRSSEMVQKLGLPQVAAFGVDSVTAAVAELWGTATKSEDLEKRQLGSFVDSKSFGQYDSSSEVVSSGLTQQLNMLLEEQRRAEQQHTIRQQNGASLFHSYDAVHISAAPSEEGVQLLLDRLALIAEAAASERKADQLQHHGVTDAASSHAAVEQCCWCWFESAVAEELCAAEKSARKDTSTTTLDATLSSVWPLPQLVLPGETVIFTWDDYRCSPCVEVSSYPWLQWPDKESPSSPTTEPTSNAGPEGVLPGPDSPSLNQPFVACIPLDTHVQGIVPLQSQPSPKWLFFRVVRHEERLLVQISPVGETLGIASAAESKHDVSARMCSESFNSPVRLNTAVSSGIDHSSGVRKKNDHVAVSPDVVDIHSLLIVPRYLQLHNVATDLTKDCSRSGEASSGADRVPEWSYASMCRFSGTIVGSYAPDQKTASDAEQSFASAKSGKEDIAKAATMLPVRPTPDPPTFELRIEVPRLQFSVLSQCPVTDPLSRQTFRLPEELILVTFEGLSAACFWSPFHSTAACRIQELQIDSMHSQAYYPVLLQRAPPMLNEVTPSGESNCLQLPQAATLTDKSHKLGGSKTQSTIKKTPCSEKRNDASALVQFLLQQRKPLYDSHDDGVVIVDKCSLSLQPITIKIDLNIFYLGSEAISCWQSAWAAATSSMSLQDSSNAPDDPENGNDTETSLASAGWPFLCNQSALLESKSLEHHYSVKSGMAWACRSGRTWETPLSLFVSKITRTNVAFAPFPLIVRPLLCNREEAAFQKEMQEFKQQRQRRYIFRVLTIDSTCIVLSFKADTGGSSSALQRSVVSLSSLEDARFQVDGLHLTSQKLIEDLQALQQKQQPQTEQDLSHIVRLMRHHKQPALSLEDVVRVLRYFYQQQFLSHLSKILVSVDVLGNPALSLAHLQAGVYALARQPWEAAETGGDVFEGMIRGAEDFLKHTGYGLFGGISRMAGAASDSLGALACDEVYVSNRKKQGRHKARNVEEGLQQGVEALGKALAGGFTGLVEEPVRGAAEGGFEGLLRGAGRGIAGFLVKPLTGVLDFAQKTAEAIKDASQVEGRQRPRFRLPRLLLGNTRLLVAYDSEAAKAKAILAEAEGQYWENLPILFFALDRLLQCLTLVTENHVLLFKYYARSSAELLFLSPLSCLLAVGHCSTVSNITSHSVDKSSGRTRTTTTKERHAVVLQLRRTGESGVYYQQLVYSKSRLQRHIMNCLRQLLLQ